LTPGAGYLLDPLTRKAKIQDITLAVDPACLLASPSGSQLQRTEANQPSRVSPRSSSPSQVDSHSAMQRPPLVARALLHSMPVAPNAPPTPSAQVFPTLSASMIGSQTNIPATPTKPPRDRPVPSTSRTPQAIVNDSSDEDSALSYHMCNTSMPHGL
jgi:hypothetical protein